MSDLVRFSITMPEDMLEALDAYTVRRGTAKNRSEAIRDLVREALVDEQVEDTLTDVMGTLTIVYDSTRRDLREKLDDIQREHFENVVTTTNVRIDEQLCMEVTILRGRSWLVRTIANAVLGTKGVLHGQLVVTTSKNPAEHSGHDDNHPVDDHSKPHTHTDSFGRTYTHTH